MKIKGSNLSCAICQPHYFPWIGYFEMIDRVDVFVFLDDVQFIKREWKNRNKIRKTATSIDSKWLTVPINKNDHKAFIKDAKISIDVDWAVEHCNSLQSVYKDSPFFEKYFTVIKGFITDNVQSTIGELNINIIESLCKELRIKTKLLRSSDLNVSGKKEEKLRNICLSLDADCYLANNATGEYVAPDYFQKDGIKFKLQNYKHPEYQQFYKGKLLPFIPYLSVVDLIVNCGDQSINVIRSKSLGDSCPEPIT